jgi:peptidoglycan/xylan/chitin deacetylase (PgdA/CDA1 family)
VEGEDEMRRAIGILAIFGLAAIPPAPAGAEVARTSIEKWQDGKRGAVSLTWDDGSANQFRVAVPIMDRLGLPATFFIITGEVAGSRYHGTFVGRPVREIVAETARLRTTAENLLERASAVGYLGYKGTLEFHTRAGEVYDERGDAAEAGRILDEGYARVRQGAFEAAGREARPAEGTLSWDTLAALARRGYELASHTVTHPRLAILDDANLVYELEKSREDILDHLGFESTFSVECPYGTENRRAVEAALARYPLARNLMPDPFVEDLDRSSRKDPATSSRDYVRWQRGALTKTPMSAMKGWVDTAAAQENIWLVLVFHGVDGVGWEPRTGGDLEEYFGYLKSREDALWVATFRDVAKYMRERMRGSVHAYPDGPAISVVLRHDLTDAAYDLPLTLRTEVPAEWAAAEVRQGGRSQRVAVGRDGPVAYVRYRAMPNAEDVTLAQAGTPPP